MVRFVYDVKLLRKIKNHKYCEELQNYINKMNEVRHGKWNSIECKKMPCIGNVFDLLNKVDLNHLFK